MWPQTHADTHRPQSSGGGGSDCRALNRPQQGPIVADGTVVCPLEPRLQQGSPCDQRKQKLQGKQPEDGAKQPATPASLQRTTAGGDRRNQGWIRQWSSHNCQHRRWLEHSCGQGREPSQGIADENGGLANDLPDEGPHLPPPQTVIQGESAMESGLGGASKSNQIHGVDPVALFRQRGSTRSPMFTVGTESVQQEQCRALTGAQRPPVDCLSPPGPRLVNAPVKGSPLGSLEARCRQGAD